VSINPIGPVDVRYATPTPIKMSGTRPSPVFTQIFRLILLSKCISRLPADLYGNRRDTFTALISIAHHRAFRISAQARPSRGGMPTGKPLLDDFPDRRGSLQAMDLYVFLRRKATRARAAKKAAREAEAGRRTFGECAAELIKPKSSEWRNEKHRAQWVNTLHDYCGPIHDVPVDAIDTQAVLGVLQPIWGRIPETASRIRGRIEAVLDYAIASGLRSGENPAACRAHLALILPKRQKLLRGHHAAMPYGDLPEFIAKLRDTESIHALALEFLVLTAGRSGEVLRATWDEIDIDAQV
jgi:hypothetical protein